MLGVGDDFDTSLKRTLDEMALAGEVPRAGPPYYYRATNVEELEDAFRTMALIAFDPVCSLLAEGPLDPSRVAVTSGGSPVPRDTDHVDGWDLADGVATFFGSFCTEIEGGRFDEVELAFCP